MLQDKFTTMMATFARIAEAHLRQVTDVQQDLTAFVREAALTLTTWRRTGSRWSG